ncbi:MAG: hypothetical protein ACIAQU_11140 [Phycisphaerales bacterium JB064]
MQLHRKPNPNDKLGCSGCLRVALLAVAVGGVGSIVMLVVAGMVF